MQQVQEVVGQARGRVAATGTVPRHGGPHGVTNESVRDGGVDRVTEHADLLPLDDLRQPDRLDALAVLAQELEAGLARKERQLVLIEADRIRLALDRGESMSDELVQVVARTAPLGDDLFETPSNPVRKVRRIS